MLSIMIKRFCYHWIFGADWLGGNIGMIGMLCRFIPLDFLAVLFIMLGGKLGGDLVVEDGKFGFQRFQLILLAPCAGGDSLECRQIHTEFFRMFLIWHFLYFHHRGCFDKWSWGHGIAVAVSVSSDTDRPGFHRREAVPAQTMRNGLQLSPSPLATFLRCREGIG